MGYVVGLHLGSFPSRKSAYTTYLNFIIFGAWTEVNIHVFPITLRSNIKKFTFTGSSISEYSFNAGHVIRLRISIYTCYYHGYVLECDSESRHSYLDMQVDGCP